VRTLLQRFLSLLNLPIPTRINHYLPLQPISLQDVEIIDDDDDLATWADAQVCDDCIELTRDYLQHCYDLDPAKHHHR
jgi:hypothetical protein